MLGGYGKWSTVRDQHKEHQQTLEEEESHFMSKKSRHFKTVKVYAIIKEGFAGEMFKKFALFIGPIRI